MKKILISLLALAATSCTAMDSLHLTDKSKEEKRSAEFDDEVLPIVFHRYYDIAVFGLENLHAADTKKYGKVKAYLTKTMGIPESAFQVPEKVSDEDLLLVHSRRYLDSLNDSKTLAQYAESLIIYVLPKKICQGWILDPMRYATQGTIDAAFLSLKYGWAINLSGGYPHAEHDKGGGFCFFADVPLAIKKVHAVHPDFKVLIVDLDVHQGNGPEKIFKYDNRVFILDVYNPYIYPNDEAARNHIDFNYPLRAVRDEAYLQVVEESLDRALEESQPNLIIYNAGTDIFEHDLLGRTREGARHISITKEGIIARDALVFTKALEKEIPIAMVLGGGTSPESHQIISESIVNILNKVVHVSIPKDRSLLGVVSDRAETFTGMLSAGLSYFSSGASNPAAHEIQDGSNDNTGQEGE